MRSDRSDRYARSYGGRLSSGGWFSSRFGSFSPFSHGLAPVRHRAKASLRAIFCPFFRALVSEKCLGEKFMKDCGRLTESTNTCFYSPAYIRFAG